MRKITLENGIEIQISEESYEELLKKSLTPIEQYIKDNPISNIVGGIECGLDYIRIPLPSANESWTFEVWNWIMNFCKEFPRAYPTHYAGDDASGYQYVNISSYRR